MNKTETTSSPDYRKLREHDGDSPVPYNPPALANAEDAVERPRLITAQEILDMPDNMLWLVDDLIPQGGVAMIVGSPGVGKTWMALLLSKSVSEGESFLGRKTTKAPVAYIDLESSRAMLKKRIEGIQPMAVKFMPGWDMDRPFRLSQSSIEVLAKEGYVIIIDCLVRAHGAEENSAKEMSVVMNRLRYLANLGGTIILLHHQGKGDENEYRGSSDILAGTDVTYSLKGRDGQLKLKTLKSRVGENIEIALSLRINDDSVELTDITHQKEAQKKEVEQEQLDALTAVLRGLSRNGQYPNQSAVVDAATTEMSVGKDAILALLKVGEGKYWEKIKDPEDSRGRIYKPITDTL